ncbi:MAG: efflux RND transporter periplasmic adaptor subunit [Hyphomicrobiaceae bacterium]|nr:efflux RND transporter periplasmic adaptor subunit [Hyphomicrobiaceae bacterium]
MTSRGSQTVRFAASLLLVALVAAGAWLASSDGPARLLALDFVKSVKAHISSVDASENAESAKPERVVTVEVSRARAATASTDIRAIGSLQSDEAVVIANEIAGRIVEIAFQEGKPVKKDQVLVKLDDQLAKAEVADAQARLDLAAANNKRAQTLSKTGIVTGKSRDEAETNFETAKAALELAKTRLSKLELRAPFDGIAGLRGVSVGAFVNVGTAIANLEKIDTLKVDFKVPETHLRDISEGQPIEITVDALPDRTFSGTIYAIDPLVDVNGRALQIRARLDNSDQILRPGLFARIKVVGATKRNVVMIPESAIVPRGEDTFVFKISDSRAVETKVQLGRRANSEVEVLDGLEAGINVVTAGQQKLRSGAAVEITPSLTERSRENPLPQIDQNDGATSATNRRG